MEVILDGDGMVKLTKDQQEFWNILRFPYKKDCFNCKSYRPDQENYCKQDDECWDPSFIRNPYKDRPSLWEWNKKLT